jgi:hypothetical protein
MPLGWFCIFHNITQVVVRFDQTQSAPCCVRIFKKSFQIDQTFRKSLHIKGSQMKFLFLFLISVGAFAATLTFKYKGQVVTSFTLEQFKSGELSGKWGKVKSQKKKIYNVFRGYERIYEGYDFYELLNAVYSEKWAMDKKVTFIAIDGYNQFTFIGEMLKAAEGKKGFLAFREDGLSGFTLVEKQGKKIDPGPWYLVWSHFKEIDKASHADTLKWPYQLTTVNID